jgi:hypothetical protein
MRRRGLTAPAEGTARFIFQAAIGVGSFCIMGSLILSAQESQVGAALFLILALISLGVIYYYGRIYLRLRGERWKQELERPQQALEQLFERARAEQEAAPVQKDSDSA